MNSGEPVLDHDFYWLHLFTCIGMEINETNKYRLQSEIACLTIVSVVWGVTNAYLKKGANGIETIHRSNVVRQLFAELWFMITTVKYIVPFLVNQAGSLLFYIVLSVVDLSLAIPFTNSLTFIFTGLTGKYLGEKFGNKESYSGIVMIILGIIMCVASKY